jgi:hypothetical protein
MSADVVYLKMALGGLVIVGNDPGEPGQVAQVSIRVRMVYCNTAWDDEGLAGSRSPAGCWISAAPSPRTARQSSSTPRVVGPKAVPAHAEPPEFLPVDWRPAEDGLVASPLYWPTQGLLGLFP